MWPFKGTVEVATLAAVALAEPEQVVEEKPDEPVIVPEYGAQASGLTQFGPMWIRLANVELVDFDPSDGCACEIHLRSRDTWHLDNAPAAALKEYLTGIGKVK